jgi:D-amino peptidase
MMKILIACDMEGISGVTIWDHVDPSHQEYQRFRRIMTADVNAAIEGAFAGGAKNIVVTDGHWNGTNILVEELDKRVVLNSGLGTSQFSMMQGIDLSFDGVIFVGYHARASSPHGVLDHTWSSKITNVWLNETLVGEYGLNGALAGHFGVPVIMISGDQTVCSQAGELIGKLEKAVVKQATGRYSAECLPPVVAQDMIRKTASVAVERLSRKDSPKPYIVPAPVTVTIEFMSSDMADRAERVPGAKRDGTKVSIQSPDMPSAYIAFRAAAGLASLA